jgi:hypothetical protein
MNLRLCRWLPTLAVLLAVATAHAAGQAPFDLRGPSLLVTVTRDGVTLPIAQAPHLDAGDKLWIKADFPESQSAHYLLIVSFLRGPTNPPAKDWFFRCEAWKRACAEQGMTVTVPKDAQQALIFLAPEAGGSRSPRRFRPCLAGAESGDARSLATGALSGSDPACQRREPCRAEGHHSAAGAQPRHSRR